VRPTRRLAPFLTLLALALIGFSVVPSVGAEVRTSPEHASKFVEDLGNSIVTLLAGYNQGGVGEHRAEFFTLVRQGFDLEVIGRFALGRSWRSATPAQRQEYQKLFAAWTINDYERLLGANMDGRLTIIGTHRLAGRTGSQATGMTFLERMWAYITLGASGITTEEAAPIVGGFAAHACKRCKASMI